MSLKVCENVYLVGGGGYSDGGDCCVYLLNLEVPLLIDSGLGRDVDKILDNIYETQINPLDIRYIILTHCHIDHIGGARQFKDRFPHKIIAHELDVDAIESGDKLLTAANWYNVVAEPVDVDIVLVGKGGSIIEGSGLKWYHIPGHTPGSIAVLYEIDEKRILFGQDIHGPLNSQFGSNREDYITSLKVLSELNADILCEGHYGIIRGRENVKKFIKQFI
ncbi:MAG: MBL fold metallo-hydrolase [Myxococcota bacterium]